MKTRDEVEALKRNWLRDSCYDLAATAGFEECRDELAAYQERVESERQLAAAKLRGAVTRLAALPIGEIPVRLWLAGLALREGLRDYNPAQAAKEALAAADDLLKLYAEGQP